MDTQNNPKPNVTETSAEYEIIHLEKTKKVCGLCEKFSTAKTEQNNLVAVMSCEGACLRGEISRRVAIKYVLKNRKKMLPVFVWAELLQKIPVKGIWCVKQIG